MIFIFVLQGFKRNLNEIRPFLGPFLNYYNQFLHIFLFGHFTIFQDYFLIQSFVAKIVFFCQQTTKLELKVTSVSGVGPEMSSKANNIRERNRRELFSVGLVSCIHRAHYIGSDLTSPKAKTIPFIYFSV